MSHRISSLGFLAAAGLAGSLLLTPPALAADLDPGYADVPPPVAQQQVTFGSGWYVRGDIAATEDYKFDVQATPKKTSVPSLTRSQDAGYDLSLGGGYSFTNSFRGDVTADFLQPISTSQHNSNGVTYAGNMKQFAALVNGYYDFGCFSIVTPYIGVGAGVGFGNINAVSYGTTRGFYTDYKNFAWALMAGVSLDVYAHTKLDVGYRYLDSGSVLGTKIFYHEVRAGLRYMIDN